MQKTCKPNDPHTSKAQRIFVKTVSRKFLRTVHASFNCCFGLSLFTIFFTVYVQGR